MKIKIFMAVKRLKGWNGITTSLEVGTHNENVRTFCNFTFSMAKGGPIDVMAVREHRPDIDVTNHNRIYYDLWKNYVEESNSAKRRTGEPAKAFNLKLHCVILNPLKFLAFCHHESGHLITEATSIRSTSWNLPSDPS